MRALKFKLFTLIVILHGRVETDDFILHNLLPNLGKLTPIFAQVEHWF